MMISRQLQLLVSLLVLFVAVSCAPHSSTDPFAGKWGLNLGNRTFLVLHVRRTGDRYSGVLNRPEHFQTSDGLRFSNVSAASISEPMVSASMQNGQLHFVTQNPADAEDKTEYEMSLIGNNQAAITLKGVPFDPWVFTKLDDTAVAPIATDWDPQRFYSFDDNAPSNAEILRIFEEDQKARRDYANITPSDWDVIGKQDAERRSQTAKLLAAGELRTAEDFTRAAFIFQHGNTSDDYLLAHTLATIAVARGNENATWIATATLDRYLQSIGQPQIYGTQFKPAPGNTATQEPFNSTLISDALRRQLGVPPLAAQEAQLERLIEQFKANAAKSK